MTALCLSSRQLATYVDLILKISWNLQNIKTFLESGEDEWTLLWKSVHHPWVIIWESFCINLILFLVGGTSVVTGDHGHMQKNCFYINSMIKRKNELWDVFFQSTLQSFSFYQAAYINTMHIFQKPALCMNWYFLIENLTIFLRCLSAEDIHFSLTV